MTRFSLITLLLVALCWPAAARPHCVASNNISTAGSRVLPLATGSLTEGSSVIQVVAWGAEWCKYCVRDKPELKRLQETGKYVIIYVDYDDNKKLAKQHGITKLPTYFVCVDDKIVMRTNSIQTLKAYKPPSK